MSGTETTELYKFKDRVEFIRALDSILPPDYIQQRDGRKYYPEPIKEAVADDIFHYWNVIDEKYMNITNELVCTVKIVFMPSYPGADELFCTGSAAFPIQMDAGSKASDFPSKKKISACESVLPNVRSRAISNALKSLGNIFGRNLDREIAKGLFLPEDFTIRETENVEPEEKKVQETVKQETTKQDTTKQQPTKQQSAKQQPTKQQSAKQVIKPEDLPF